MTEDVGSRVVRVGLATREQLAEALSLCQRSGMPLVEALVCMGVDEESIAGLFAAEGLAAALPAGALERANVSPVAGFDGTMALAFLALPLRTVGERLEVAMADPTDAHAIAELRRRAAADVLPLVARVTPIREAILARFPDARAAVAVPESIPIEPRSLLESSGASLPSARAVVASLVPVPTTPLPRPRRISSVPEPTSLASSRDRWDDLEPGGGGSIGTVRVASRTYERGARLPEVASIVAGIRASSGRDVALGLACEGAIAIARSAIFFSRRRDVLRGQVARGPLLDDGKAKLVEVPLGSESVLARAFEDALPYFGPFGTGLVDQMVRASLGSRGGPLSVHPVQIDTRCVGLLVAEDVRHGERGDERIAMLAHAIGGALRRLVAEGRTP